MIRAILLDYAHTLVDIPSPLIVESELTARLASLLETEGYGQRIDLESTVRKAIRHVFATIGNSYTTQRQIKELDIISLYREAFSTQEYTLPTSLLKLFCQEDHVFQGDWLTVSPLTLDALETCKTRGYQLCIVSNTIYQLRFSGTFPLVGQKQSLIDQVVFSGDLGWRKPSPQIYYRALAVLGRKPEEVVFVGDRIVEDIRGPKSVGIEKSFLSHEFRQEEDTQREATATLTRFCDILDPL